MTESQPTAIIATVTGKDLLDKLDSLSGAVTHLSTKLDDIPARVADHETRLRGVEKRIWMASGVAALVSSGAVALVLELSARKS